MQPQMGQDQRQTENIEAVLGRFEAWTSARKKSDLGEGVRELSYEEALRSSRYRWQAYADEAIKRQPEHSAAVDPAAEVDATSKATARKSDVAPSPQAVTGSATRRGSAKAEAGRKRVKGKAQSLTTLPDTDFRGVLVEQIRELKREVQLATVEQAEVERQVSLSIRLASSERELVKARAAEAGVSVSAYLRQCALEVEQLRAQVQMALAALEQSADKMQPELPGNAPRPGFFTRIRRRFFGGAGTLALRA